MTVFGDGRQSEDLMFQPVSTSTQKSDASSLPTVFFRLEIADLAARLVTLSVGLRVLGRRCLCERMDRLCVRVVLRVNLRRRMDLCHRVCLRVDHRVRQLVTLSGRRLRSRVHVGIVKRRCRRMESTCSAVLAPR